MPAAGRNSLIGQTLAERYHVTAKLGEGGMGSVYVADDIKLQSEVVIKTPHAALIKDAEFAARFRREIRSLVQLSHAHIVKVMDVGVHDGLPFAVMQYLPGGSLDGKNRPCAPVEVLEWLGDIADALDFMHQQGLIHRDVKPANILFDESGRAYLGDFGIAKVVAASDESDQKQITGTGTMIGTAEFMAPEMLMPDLYSDEYDERVDQYALAVTVYEMLAGRPPFRGDTIATVAVKLAKTKATLLHELRPGIPEELSKVVARGLLKKPDRRYPNCRAFAESVFGAVSGDTNRRTVVSARGLTGAEQRENAAPQNERRVTAAAKTQQEQRSRRRTMAVVEQPVEIDDLFPLRRGSQTSTKRQRSPIVTWLTSSTGISWSVACGIFLVAAIAILQTLDDAPGRPAAGPQQVNRDDESSSDSIDGEPKSTSLPQVELDSGRIAFDFDNGIGPNFTVLNESGLFEVDTDGSDLRIAKSADDGRISPKGFVNAGYRSKFTVEGNFTATIDFTLHNLPAANDKNGLNESLFMVTTEEGGVFEILRFRRGDLNLIDIFYQKPVQHVAGGIAESALSKGQYRLSRVGSTVTAQFATRGSSEFTSVGSVSQVSGPVRIQALAVQGRGSGPQTTKRSTTAIDISFDNLVIEAVKFNGLIDNSSDMTARTARPSLAIAPFEAQQAAKHQQAWAEYLGTPVEITNSIGMKFRLIPPGEFEMGSPPELIHELVRSARDAKWKARYQAEGPKHAVRVSRAFYFGSHEVTQHEYQAVVGANPSSFRVGGINEKYVSGVDTKHYPVDKTSWYDAVAFCNKLSGLEGRTPYYDREESVVKVVAEANGYRLPTEAEWEYAHRAGATTQFFFGDDRFKLNQYGWYDQNSASRTHPVGQTQPNGFKLYDTHGNVWEWCFDWYDVRYYGIFSIRNDLDPMGPESGDYRVMRGGGCGTKDYLSRSGFRGRQAPDAQTVGEGFRVVLPIKPATAKLDPVARPSNTAPLVKLPNSAIFIATFEPNTITKDGDKMVAADLSGHNDHAELSGLQTEKGKVGQALLFSGDDELVQTSVLQSDCSTIVMWLNVAAFDKPIHLVQGANDGVGFAVFIDTSETARFRFGDGQYHDTTIDHGLQPGKWRHMAIVIEHETSRFRYYLDGQLVHLGPMPKKLRFSDRKLSLGHAGVQSVRRSIDEFAIFNRVLSEAEIKSIRGMGLAGESLATSTDPDSKASSTNAASARPKQPRSRLLLSGDRKSKVTPPKPSAPEKEKRKVILPKP